MHPGRQLMRPQMQKLEYIQHHALLFSTRWFFKHTFMRDHVHLFTSLSVKKSMHQQTAQRISSFLKTQMISLVRACRSLQTALNSAYCSENEIILQNRGQWEMLCKSHISRSVATGSREGAPRASATLLMNDTVHLPTQTRQLHSFAHFVGGVKEKLLVPHCAQQKAFSC